MKPPRHRSQWSDLAQHLGLEGMNDEALAEAARLAAQPPAKNAPAPVEDVENVDVRHSEEVVRDVEAVASTAEPDLLPEPPKSSRWSSLASALGLRWRDKEPATPPASQPAPKRPEPEAKRPEPKPEPRREAPAPEPPARREEPKPVEPAEEDDIGWGRPARRERKSEERESRPAAERSERESRPREESGEGRRGREERPRREERERGGQERPRSEQARPRREEERPRRDEGRAISEAQAGELPPRGEPTGGFGSGLLDFEDAPPPSSAERATTGRHAFRSDEDVETDEFADRTPAAERGEEGDRPRRRRRRRGRGGAEAGDESPPPSRPFRDEPISGALDDEEDVELESDPEAAVLEEGETGEVSETRRRRRRRRRGGSSSREEGAEPARRSVGESARRDGGEARPAKPAPAARRDFDEDDEFEDDEEEDESLDGSRIAAEGDEDDEEDEPSEARSRHPRSRRRRSSSERTTAERSTSERAPSQREGAGEGTSRSSRSSRGEGRGDEPRRSDRGEKRTREDAPAKERVREEREPVVSDRDDELVEPLGVDPRFAKIPTWLYCVSSVIDGNLAKRGTSQESDRPRRSRRPPRRPTN